MKAIWKDKIIAESDDTIVMEGRHYFPADSIKSEYFKTSDTKSTCHWKGEASYYNVDVNGEVNGDSAWYYPKSSELAKSIEGRIAFWKGVNIVDQ